MCRKIYIMLCKSRCFVGFNLSDRRQIKKIIKKNEQKKKKLRKKTNFFFKKIWSVQKKVVSLQSQMKQEV